VLGAGLQVENPREDGTGRDADNPGGYSGHGPLHGSASPDPDSDAVDRLFWPHEPELGEAVDQDTAPYPAVPISASALSSTGID